MDQDVETRLRNLRRAPRCGAMTRAGTACQRPAMHGRKRCRLHGGLSPGAPRGHKNGNYKNGNWTADTIEERRWLRSLVQSFANNGTTNDEQAEQLTHAGGWPEPPSASPCQGVAGRWQAGQSPSA